MDEESTEDLSWLASNSKRNVFNRMVSWEFSQETKPLKLRRRHKSKKSSLTEEDPEASFSLSDLDIVTSSDDSEYYSAEEDDDNQSETSSKDTLSESFASSADSVFQSVSNEGASLADVQINKQDNTRHRAPSKRQKRRKRKTDVNNDFLPFYELDDVLFSFTECYKDIQNQSDVEVLRLVPSLAEICIHNIHRHKKMHTKTNTVVPKPLKNLVVQQALKVKLQKIQMTWLITLLSHFNICNSKGKSETNLLDYYRLLYCDNEDDYDAKRNIFVDMHTRNVWNFEPFEHNDRVDPYIGSKVSSFLPYLCALGDRATKQYADTYNYCVLEDIGKAYNIMSMMSGN